MLDIMLQIHTDTVLIPCKMSHFLVSCYFLSHRHHAVNIKHHVWLQVMQWLASTMPNALGTVAEVDNEVDLEEDVASGVSS